jgi:DNA-binding CsgD family transcriptional regulator
MSASSPPSASAWPAPAPSRPPARSSPACSPRPPTETGLPAAVIPAADAARLLPGTGPTGIPGVTAPATLEAALDEMESLMLTLARLRSNEEIADRLYLSVSTAKTHATRAMAKLGARDRAQLVVIAYESSLVRPGCTD